MFIKLESIDVYRSQIRPLIKEWLKILVKGSQVSWTVITVVPGKKRDSRPHFIKASFFDRLKADFGINGKQLTDVGLDSIPAFSESENFIKVKEEFDDEIQRLEAYNEITNQIKAFILQTFTRRYQLLLLKYRPSKIPPDANFPVTRFLEGLKLASVLKDIRILSDSLDVYEQLFSQLKSVSLSHSDLFTYQEEPPASGDLNQFSPESAFNPDTILLKASNLLRDGAPVDITSLRLGLFLKVSSTLQLLANFATSLSISSIFISDLFQKVIYFLSGFRVHPNSTSLHEWSYVVAEYYLNLPISEKLIEIDNSNSSAQNSESHVTEIFKFKGEMMLLKRTLFKKIAFARGLSITDASRYLEDISFSQDIENKDLEALTYKPLIDALQTQDSCDETFRELTVSAIENFALCNSSKTIDILSIDLAMLHYSKKEYEEANEILLMSYDYFLENGWTFMGKILLQMHLDCIRHLDIKDNESCITSFLKLFSTLKIKGNTMSVSRSATSNESLFTEICELSEQVLYKRVLPLFDYFKVDINPFVDDDGAESYFISVQIANDFPIPIKLRSARLIVAHCENLEEELFFTCEDLVLLPQSQTKFELKTTKLYPGVFSLRKIALEATENLVFSVSIEDNSKELQDTSIIYSNQDPAILPSTENVSTQLANLRLHVFSHGHNLQIWFEPPKENVLGKSSLECVVQNGTQLVENVKIKLQTFTAGLRVPPDFEPIGIDVLKPQEIQRHRLDFSESLKQVELAAKCTFEIDGKVFERNIIDEHDLSLPISITVRDVFRLENIYCRFQVNSTGYSLPVRVTNWKLRSSNENIVIQTPDDLFKDGKSILVFGEQIISLFYKISIADDSFDASDILDLDVSYSSLKAECQRIAKLSLQEHLNRTGLSKYQYPASLILKNAEFNLRTYGHEGKVILSNQLYLLMLIDQNSLQCVSPVHRAQYSKALMSFIKGDHQATETSELVSVVEQELHIPVPVPFIDLLHTVEFKYDKKSHYLVGEPIETELLVRSTRKWAKSSEPLASSSQNSIILDQEHELELTIETDENWLISGFKQIKFVVHESESFRFFVALIPLNVGDIRLPKVDVRCPGNENLAMDQISENASETILIVPELQYVTLTL